MKKKRQKPENIRVRCPYCGRMARLHPASYVYGSDNLDSESYLYVCDGYPAVSYTHLTLPTNSRV